MYHPNPEGNRYLVRLHAADGVSTALRIAAEVAFARELERIFGGAAQVARACADARAKRWDEACATATAAVAGQLQLHAVTFSVDLKGSAAGDCGMP